MIILKRTKENLGKALCFCSERNFHWMTAKYVWGLTMQNSPPWLLGVWFLTKPGIFHLAYCMVGRHFRRSGSETNLNENGQRYRQSYGSLTILFLLSGKFLPRNRGVNGKNGCSGSWVVLLMALWEGGTSGGEEPWELTTTQPLLAYLFRFLTKTPYNL